jgi:formate hydrogenlyase subunit 6/NADH:ubiquinone oxidoreductase subunit I
MKNLLKKMGVLSAILEAFGNEPETISYPGVPLVLPNGYRGEIVMLESEKCSGCGLCVRDCPAQALELIKESREAFCLIYYPARCAYCGQCEESCRNQAISHVNQLSKATRNLDNSRQILKDTRAQLKEEH